MEVSLDDQRFSNEFTKDSGSEPPRSRLIWTAVIPCRVHVKLLGVQGWDVAKGRYAVLRGSSV